MAQDKYEMNHKILAGMLEESYDVLHEFDRSTESAANVNTQLLMRILNDSKDTEYGRKYGFGEIHDADEYRRRVPLTTYADYESYIDRMVNDGEENLLTSYPIVYYAETSGTSGKPKYIPVSDRGLEVFRNYFSSIILAVISEFHKTTRLKDLPDGFKMMELTLSKHSLPCGVNAGAISAACVKDEDRPLMPFIFANPAEAMFCTEGANLKYIYSFFALSERRVNLITGSYIPIILDTVHYIRDNWQSLVSDIRAGTLSNDAVMPDYLCEELSAKITPNPERADELEREFAKGFDSTILKRIWPNLSGIGAIWAGNFSSYARKLQKFTGMSVPYYTIVYAASEGVYGTARHPFDQCYVMIPGSCFFEFIPANSIEEDCPATVLFDGVQEGKDYELVITNQSGFYRYRTGDVIRVIGFYNEAPMVVFKYRTKTVASISGEKFTEDDLASAVREFERRTGISVVDFCMYADRSTDPGRYVIIMEPDEEVPKSRMKELVDIMEQELIRTNDNYAYLPHLSEDGGSTSIGKPRLIFLQPQTFQLYRDVRMYKTGITENQLKTIRFLDKSEIIKFFTALEAK
ncbi:MAG: GH3 auxin-responsive promoter family protein [Synergistaceae bacterium]|nr:GH3 auxin-responsive promoter family protein [Synergistaceae bacterium]